MELTNAQLLEKIAEGTEQIAAIETRIEPLRAELQKRMLTELHQSGDMTPLEHNGYVAKLAKEAMTIPWLKRWHGYEESDIPDTCFTEKISRVPDWSKVSDHFGGLSPSYALRIARAKVK